MAAIWFSLTVCAAIAASQARTWRGWTAFLVLGVIFAALLRHTSPLIRELLG